MTTREILKSLTDTGGVVINGHNYSFQAARWGPYNILRYGAFGVVEDANGDDLKFQTVAQAAEYLSNLSTQSGDLSTNSTQS